MKAILLVVGLLAVGSCGVVAGVWLEKKNAPAKALAAIQSRLPYVAPQTQVVSWQAINTNLHVIQFAAVKVSGFRIEGGSLAEMGGNIVLASPQGQLSYLDARYQLHPLELHAPMNLEDLRNDPLYKETLFNAAVVRTLDLLVIQTGADTYDLYASFHRFVGGCFNFVVSRVAVQANDQIVKPIGDWHDLWTATPCIGMKDRGQLFAGSQSGGRMVRLTDDTILVSVGDHFFDGFNDSHSVSMDPKSDLGKLIELNIKTGSSRHFAIGLRNPQGLTIAPDGRIWETEHGPQGGDEVNVMTEGQNYGWPVVTYGMNYGYPLKNWPFNPRAGGHDGYARPRFAFVPSIGISNIIAPDLREFPNWADSLILCSLKANTLYVLRTDGNDIVYSEPIRLDGYRLRDIASLRDGRLAILADGGSLLFVRNAELHRDDAQQVEVAGLPSLPRPSPEEAPRLTQNTAERGKLFFGGICAKCHSLAGEIGVGPPLNGVVGRRIAGVPNFGYSPALSRRKDIWTTSLIDSFLVNPQGVAPGTSMPDIGIDLGTADDVATYLEQTH